MKIAFKILTLFSLVLFLSHCDTSQAPEQKETEKTELEVQPEIKPTWEVVKTVDKFGDETEEKAIIGIFEGKMSNSAVSNEALKVKVQVQDSSAFISFYEYGDLIGQLPENKFLNIDMKLNNGEVVRIEQFLFKNMMVDNKGVLLNHLLSQTNPIKLIVDLRKLNMGESTVYNFSIDPKGLKELM